ncbi:MAG: DUF354 domain-containing protein [bacterium]|nr:DUF354 domain-containing protein [bacterium]
MRFAIDILHPAHVHFFRHFIDEMQQRGHDFLVTARDKDCSLDLLRELRIPHSVISSQARGGVALALELLTRTWRFWRRMRRSRPDYLLGIMGPTIALAGTVSSAKTIVFYDTEMARVTNCFVFPLADRVCTPECYQEQVGKNHVTYPGYHELAYLHPRRFRPDRGVLAAAGLDGDQPLYIVRFVSWEASHDVGESGFSLAGKRKLVALLAEKGRVLVSSEAPLPEDLAQYHYPLPASQIHHVLAFADLLVGESATMASEAAVLGTHALLVSKTGRGYTDEQEARYGLVHNFTHQQEHDALARVRKLIGDEDLKNDALRRRARLLEEHIDVTRWMIDYFESDQSR